MNTTESVGIQTESCSTEPCVDQSCCARLESDASVVDDTSAEDVRVDDRESPRHSVVVTCTRQLYSSFRGDLVSLYLVFYVYLQSVVGQLGRSMVLLMHSLLKIYTSLPCVKLRTLKSVDTFAKDSQSDTVQSLRSVCRWFDASFRCAMQGDFGSVYGWRDSVAVDVTFRRLTANSGLDYL